MDSYPVQAGVSTSSCAANFLDRRLLPNLRESLRPDGILLYESFKQTDLDDMDQPCNTAYLLRTNELLQAFLRMLVLYYEEVLLPAEQMVGFRILAMLAAQNGWTRDQALTRSGLPKTL